MLALDWCEKTFPASLTGFKSKGEVHGVQLIRAQIA